MDDQASAIDPLDELAKALDGDEPESVEDQPETEASAEESEKPTSDEEPKTDEPQPEPTFKVKLPTGEVEVTQSELVSGYMKEADYRQKTQELAQRERETTQAVFQRLTQAQEAAQRATEEANALVAYALQAYPDDQLAQLAETNPAEYVKQQHRIKMINDARAQLQQRADMARQAAQEQQAAAVEQARKASWDKLAQEKIDRPALEKIYAEAKSAYGLTDQELDGILDARAVLIMRDAIAFRQGKKSADELISKTQKQVAAAPSIKAKAVEPQSSRNVKAEQRIRSGKGTLHDLAALL